MCTKYRERTENFKGLNNSLSHKFHEDAVSVESNNTHFPVSLFENFLKDILKSAPYLLGTLINEGVVKYLRWLRMSLTFRSSYPLQRNNNTLQQWSKHRFILCHATWNWLNRLNVLVAKVAHRFTPGFFDFYTWKKCQVSFVRFLATFFTLCLFWRTLI